MKQKAITCRVHPAFHAKVEQAAHEAGFDTLKSYLVHAILLAMDGIGPKLDEIHAKVCGPATPGMTDEASAACQMLQQMGHKPAEAREAVQAVAQDEPQANAAQIVQEVLRHAQP